jgi:hypothetical protein
MTYRSESRISKASNLLVIAVVLGCATMAVPVGQAQSMIPPTTPAIISPPAENALFLVGHAVGTQGYVCLPTSPGALTASWTAKGARPEATLFLRYFGQDFQIITHFLSPDTSPNDAAPSPLPAGSATWQSSYDSSKVWAQVLHGNMISAGSDSSCPNSGAIPCLLLESIGSQAGPTGGTILTKATFVQRLNTIGGSAPASGCATPVDLGSLALVPYEADYYFYRKDK